MKTIAMHATDDFEAVAFLEYGETDEDTGEEVTAGTLLYNLQGRHEGGTARIRATFASAEQEKDAAAWLASMTPEKFVERFQPLAKFYRLDDE